MTMFAVIVATAVDTVLAMAATATARRMWANRRQPIDWMLSGRKALARRRHLIERAKHDELVAWVLARAGDLRLGPGEDLPIKITGRDPAVITFHPTQRNFAMFRDLPSYRSAAERGLVNPAHAHYGPLPRTVGKWTADELRLWLLRHDAGNT